ncbi:MAG: thioester reductase domain-containing protein [Oligoflexales bacterium]|nr:thioester reductase domain-containing protein [Oligoflexales bacterium]
MDELISSLKNRVFDIERGPLFSVSIIRRKDKEHILVVVFHHIISDIWSAMIFIREFSLVYSALVEGNKAELAPISKSYRDFVSYEKDRFGIEKLEIMREHWNMELSGIDTVIDFPYDLTAPNELSGKSESISWKLKPTDIDEFCRGKKVTPFVLFATALDLLIYAISEQENIVLGVPHLNRPFAGAENLIGFFANISIVKSAVSDDETLQELIDQIGKNILDTGHTMIPFGEMVPILRKNMGLVQKPPVQVVLSYMNQMESLNIPGCKATMVELKRPYLDFELFFTVLRDEEGYTLNLDYMSELFSKAFIGELMEKYQKTIEFIIENPDKKASEIFAHAGVKRKNRIRIVSTFTAEPIHEPLRFWMNSLGVRSKIEFEGFNQVFQSLLDRGSLIRTNENGINVILIRYEDWIKDSKIDRNNLCELASEFAEYLKNAAKEGRVPYIAIICRSSPKLLDDENWKPVSSELTDIVKKGVSGNKQIFFITDEDLMELYPVENYFDAEQLELGHIPYTGEYYTALSTMISRRLYMLQNAPCKVIVLDCDNTLWRGVVGEDGINGIKFDVGCKALQEFAVRQHDQGVLICLCSKNIEEDVMQVFESRNDMILKKEHLVGWRINWNSKSENMLSLAEELGLGLDSFVFIDDNPVECAEVRANCPDVLTIRFHPEYDRVLEMINHTWFFDRLSTTDEDKKRTGMYKQEIERNRALKEVASYEDFIKKLDLAVEIEPVSEGEYPRASQLTLKTNQFNSTTVRRTETELRNLIKTKNAKCYTVKVKDRFGDYGLVGLMICIVSEKHLVADTFLLSCRVLGRRVEHRMVGKMKELAEEMNLFSIRFDFFPTAKNRPVLDFLKSIGSKCEKSIDKGLEFVIPVEEISDRLERSLNLNEVKGEVKAGSDEGRRISGAEGSGKNNIFQKILERYSSVQGIKNEVDKSGYVRKIIDRTNHVDPETETQAALHELWSRVLKIERIGVLDNFFLLGGTSLSVVQILAGIRNEFMVPMPYDIFVNNATIAKISMIVDGYRKNGSFGETAAEAISLLREARLPDDIAVAKKTRTSRRLKKVFLTGATGFLGAYVLKELVRNKKLTVCCLVRAGDRDSGLSRIKNNLVKYGLWDDGIKSRVEIILGDLSEAKLGLSDDDFDRLSRDIDAIYHNGSVVNFVYPYNMLKDGNVRGTVEIIRLASTNISKPIHYVSSTAIFDSVKTTPDQIIKEEHVNDDGSHVIGGYAQTKWVCEKMLHEAIKKGLKVAIYRPAAIGPVNDKNGVMPVSDALTAFMLACADMGAAPDFADANVDYSPVDYVAKSYIEISLDPNSWGKVFHLGNPRPVSFGKVSKLMESCGQPMELVPYAKWVDMLKHYVPKSGNENLKMMLPIFEDRFVENDKTWFEIIMKRARFDCRNTEKALLNKNVKCEKIDKVTIKNLLDLVNETNRKLKNGSN